MSTTPTLRDAAPQVADLLIRITNCAKHWAYMAEIDNGDAAKVEAHRHGELLAELVAALTQGAGDCPRCQGSGEDPEGFFDQSRGPDGATHDGPCRECGGSGGAGEAVEPVATDAEDPGLFRHFDGMCWPVPGEFSADLEWRSRHSHTALSMSDRVCLASIVSAYAYLISLPAKNRDKIIRELRKGPQLPPAAAAIRAKGTHD